MKRIHFLLPLLIALCAFPASAILDTNSNGMSDLWERQFNDQQLFGASFLPLNDDDGDGWSNGEEATAGTDPRNADSPDGMLQPELTILHDVSLDLDGNGIDESYAEVARIAWPIIAGKQYTLQCSTDLTDTSWVAVEQAPADLNGVRTSYFPLTQEEKLFWRVAVEDADSDSDGLSDAEEGELNTDPSKVDTDGDGVSDWDEVMANSTNPLSAIDADNDGIPDDLEKHLALQLLAFQPAPAAWGAYYAGLALGDLDATHDYTGDGMPASELAAILAGIPAAMPSGSGFLMEPQMRRNELLRAYYRPASETNPLAYIGGSYWQSNRLGYGDWTDLNSVSDFTPSYLVGHIDAVEWGATTIPSFGEWVSGAGAYAGEAASGFLVTAEYSPGVTSYEGFIRQQRFRIIAKRADHVPLDEQYLKITSKRLYGTSESGEILTAEPFEIQIPRGKFLTEWLEFNAPMVGGQDTVVRLLPVEFIDTQGSSITQLPTTDRAFFHSLIDNLGTADTSSDGNDPPSGDGSYDREAGYVSQYYPPTIPEHYKFKLRIGDGLWSTSTATVQFQGLDASNSETELVDVEMEKTGGVYISKKTICAVEGGIVDAQVKSSFPDVIFIDPAHFKVKVQKPDQPSAQLEVVDKATTMAFPAIRWRKSGSWSVLTDAYNSGKTHPEPASNALAFDNDHEIELFAIVRLYDKEQNKLRYFCGAGDKPSTISVVEQRQGTRKSAALESPNDAPEALKQVVKWFYVNPDITISLENRWQAATEAAKWAALNYVDEEIQDSSGEWKISIGGDINKGVNRYKVTFGSAESPGAQFRQNTVEDHRVSDLVMRVIVKGDYSTDYLRWASTFINVPFVDGSHHRQVEEYVAIDCADTCLESWIRAGHAVPNFSNQSAQSIVTKAQQGTYTMVLAPSAVYPEADTDTAHLKWSQIERPEPGDLIIWDWPEVRQASFDHATIYVGTDGNGTALSPDGSDKTIYAGAASFQYRVRSAAYNGINGVPGLWNRIQSGGQGIYLPVRIAIVRLK